jgi:signal transduction histidine kinase
VLIEGERLRLVSMDGLPADLRGRTADLPSSLVGELMRSGNTVLMRTGESGRFDDLIWSALPGLHTITLSLSHVAGRPYGALYALYSGRKVGHVDLELLELLAGHASVALSNATAFAEVVRQRAHERAVIDGSADGIAVLDRQGLVRQWNPAAHALTGVSAGQAVGKVPPFPLPEPGATLTWRLKNERWINVLCTVLEGRDEQVIDFRDVTAAKELEEAKDLFLATTSHELRTPITVVQGFASTLANRWDKLIDKDRRMAVETIAERAESLARLVDQLLLGSRAGANRLSVTSEPFDLARLLNDAVTVFRPLSDRHAVVAMVPENLPEAFGDAAATDSIVGQLIENAFKYSPDGGTVTIAAADVPGTGEIEVTVQDEGIGIAPADVERVFERFVQGEAGDRRRFGGIGLGLYIVRQLARAQGGDVTAAPAPGRGTIMRLTLPRAASRSAAAAPVAVADGRAADNGVEPTGAAPEAVQPPAPAGEAESADDERKGAAESTGAEAEPKEAADAGRGGGRQASDDAEVAALGGRAGAAAESGAEAANDGGAAKAADDAAASGSENGEVGEAPVPEESTDSEAKPRANGRRLPPVLARLPIPRSTSDRGAGRKG